MMGDEGYRSSLGKENERLRSKQKNLKPLSVITSYGAIYIATLRVKRERGGYTRGDEGSTLALYGIIIVSLTVWSLYSSRE